MVVGPVPKDPVEFRKFARDLKALSAAKEHTNEERGGGRDPSVRRPGAGRGQLPARSKIFRAAMHVAFCLFSLKLLTNRFVSTTKIWMKYVVNWIPLRIRVRSKNTQPHLTPPTQCYLFPILICFFHVETHKVSTSIWGGVSCLTTQAMT